MSRAITKADSQSCFLEFLENFFSFSPEKEMAKRYRGIELIQKSFCFALSL